MNIIGTDGPRRGITDSMRRADELNDPSRCCNIITSPCAVGSVIPSLCRYGPKWICGTYIDRNYSLEGESSCVIIIIQYIS